jgi:NAD(P)H-dependent flavin oxidoreductase YrpB (nitropropane dioxygenase family)
MRPMASISRFHKSEEVLGRQTSVSLLLTKLLLTGSQYDYTHGQLPELIDVIIEEKAALFVCAVGVPPKFAVERLHKAGIPIMNVRFFFYQYEVCS